MARSDPNDSTALSPEQAARYALIHLLAIESFSLSQISRKLRMQPEKAKLILDRVSDSNEDTSSYSLARKCYKELEPWEFPYSSDSDREKAINNAIHAFDSMRVDSHDKIWQTLLPESERNQGKTLSKLKLQTVSTPRVKPVAFDRKTGLPKRAEPKKAEKPQKPSEVSKAEKSMDSKKKPESVKAEREPASKPTTKKTGPAQRPNSSTSTHGSPQTKEKPSSSAKSLLNKPKNPSPLAASPPVNASDFEDNHPVHRALSATPTKGMNGNANGVKRKPIDTAASTAQRPTKQPNLGNGVLPSSTKKKEAAANPKPIEKRKADNDDHESRPRKVARDGRTPSQNHSVIRAPKTKQVSTPSNITASNKQSTTYSSAIYARSSTSDSASPDGHLTLSNRQRLELAEKFKRYYANYHKLYMKLSKSTKPPSQLEVDELMKKHNKLAEMKARIKTGLV
jgi:RNA polymerase II elongation factor ELL